MQTRRTAFLKNEAGDPHTDTTQIDNVGFSLSRSLPPNGYPTSSLADLYDPDTMPPPLRKAHAALDSAVDRLYRAAPFGSDRDRVEHLFGRYEALVNPLGHEAVKQNRRINRKRGSGA